MLMRKKLIFPAVALVGLMLLFNSCKKEYESIQSIDDAKIQAYIKQKNLTMKKDPSGFYYQVVEQGTGAPLLNKDSVFYNLAVKSLTGASYYNTAAYATEGTYLGYLAPEAYRIALTGVNRGGKVKVILPSYLAYGKNGNAQVPSNEVILSDLVVSPLGKQWEIDDKSISEYLTKNNIAAVKNSARVYVIIDFPGTGTAINSQTSTITVNYTGKLLNGTVFDQNNGLSSRLDGLIMGWRKTLVGLNQGTKLRFYIPSDLAYGTAGSRNSVTGEYTVPPNSPLAFEIEITAVTN